MDIEMSDAPPVLTPSGQSTTNVPDQASTPASDESEEAPPKTLADVLANDECMEKILEFLNIRDVMSLRQVPTVSAIVSANYRAQEKVFLRPVISFPELELNPLLFAGPHRYFAPNSVQLVQLDNGVYELHFTTRADLQELLRESNSSIKNAVFTRPSSTQLVVHMRSWRGNLNVAMKRTTITTIQGVTYGDVMKEIVEMAEEKNVQKSNPISVEIRFPPGQQVRMGPYREIMGVFNRNQRRRLGI